jgi:transcription antitermination factor NusG
MTHEWYALQVRSRFESVVATRLREKGYEVFCPTYKVRRKWSDRAKTIEAALFTGYLFCQFDVHKRLPILITPGVVAVVGVGRIPAAVDEAEIEAIHKLVHSGAVYNPHPYLSIGDRVRILHGSLFGLTGIIVQSKKNLRVVLSVNLLMRSVSIEVEESWVELISRSARPGEERIA